MAIEKLSALKIDKTKRPGLYGDGGSLYLRIAPGGSKGWIFRYRRHGRLRDMGLGSITTFSLRDAREAARSCRQLLYAGVDPIEERRGRREDGRLEAARSTTFRKCAEAYIAVHAASWRNPKHATQWPSTLETYVYPTIGQLSVQRIDAALVLRRIEPIWLTKTETASRVRGRIETILDWAAARGLRRGENPARWRGHLENLLPRKSKVAKVEHHAALPYAAIASFTKELRAQHGVSPKALLFTILTVARTQEVLGARWNEIDCDSRIWTVPDARMKADKVHRVPLSEASFALIEEMWRIRRSDDGYIFPGSKPGRPLSQMALLMLLRRLGYGELTVHGFRSCFTDWAAETTDFPDEVRAMSLAHVVSDKVEAAYRRGDFFEKRRALAQAWADYCLCEPVPAAQSEASVARA